MAETSKPSTWLKPGEYAVELFREGLKVIQSRQGYCFTMDAVLLAFFVTLKPGSRVADLGTGSGIIPLLLTTRAKDLELWGFELQEALAERAQRSVRLNGLDSLIKIQRLDLRRTAESHPPDSFATVVCNPPYWPLGQGRISSRAEVAKARHEVDCTLEEAVQAGQWLLRPGGGFALVQPWQRRIEALETLAKYGLQLKRWREVRHKSTVAPSLILVEAIKADKKSTAAVGLPTDKESVPAAGLPIAGDLEREIERSRLEPLVIYDQQGKFLPEVAAIYHG